MLIITVEAGITGAGAFVNVNAGTLAYANNVVADLPTTSSDVASGATSTSASDRGFSLRHVRHRVPAPNVVLGTAQNLALRWQLTSGRHSQRELHVLRVVSGGGPPERGHGADLSGTKPYTGRQHHRGTSASKTAARSRTVGHVLPTWPASRSSRGERDDRLAGGGGTTGCVVDIGAQTLTVAPTTRTTVTVATHRTGLVVKTGSGQWRSEHDARQRVRGKYRVERGTLSFRDESESRRPGAVVADAITLNAAPGQQRGGDSRSTSTAASPRGQHGIAVYGRPPRRLACRVTSRARTRSRRRASAR